ncbi:septum site-determining protein Ssd [Rhizohabitans arisaemae]|uniref:septum site-determining protein Ssd n=1 Tax=Rhizohabitans arisaemae TaxID=2720610 RepID=UPI0024B04BC1|nr:septum site-determining protein Ssd [Rhizohabitans arisaemae]
MNRPLIITDDQDLLDDLLRLAAAAGVEVDVAYTAGHARPHWSAAPLVVIGADLADELAAIGLPQRTGVLLVVAGAQSDDIWRRCVSVGAQTVLTLPESERVLIDEFAETIEPVGRGAAVVCVIGGRGGAGASVLATGLALTAARGGLSTLLVDADPLGGGIDLVLGEEQAAGARWPDFVAREGRVSALALRDALPALGELAVLSWHRGEVVSAPPEAMRAVLAAGVRGCELVVVDVPRHLDPGAHEALQRANQTLLVVPAQIRAVAAASQVFARIREHTGDVRLVVRGDGLEPEMIARSLGLPLAGTFTDERGLRDALEHGDLPTRGSRGPLASFSDRFLRSLLQAGGPA